MKKGKKKNTDNLYEQNEKGFGKFIKDLKSQYLVFCSFC